MGQPEKATKTGRKPSICTLHSSFAFPLMVAGHPYPIALRYSMAEKIQSCRNIFRNVLGWFSKAAAAILLILSSCASN